MHHCRSGVKAKKGVNLLQTRSKNAQWRVDWEVQSGAKHSITTIDVNKNKVKQGEVMGNVEVMQLDFEMENFTSLSVTRRINWNIDYRGQNPALDSEKVVTELTVVQRDIQAIIPLAMPFVFIAAERESLTGRLQARVYGVQQGAEPWFINRDVLCSQSGCSTTARSRMIGCSR
ncbi:Transmembrane protein 132E [Takifugu flavidus]|uniref:Transmembrane protein 132E n=1 Tax=Takifugu flavidus TaxID=433684 RepID=A0A5C6P8L8_9TELE|nr:Transmembrane protein 132E [Takifugu flavidus]